jgi:hypothetical protein
MIMMEPAVLSKEEISLDAVVEMNVFLRGMNEPIQMITRYEWAMGFHFAWTEFVDDNTKTPIGSIKSTSERAIHIRLSEVLYVTVSVH